MSQVIFPETEQLCPRNPGSMSGWCGRGPPPPAPELSSPSAGVSRLLLSCLQTLLTQAAGQLHRNHASSQPSLPTGEMTSPRGTETLFGKRQGEDF